jgi:putative ABC transport system substrate-binding protein
MTAAIAAKGAPRTLPIVSPAVGDSQDPRPHDPPIHPRPGGPGDTMRLPGVLLALSLGFLVAPLAAHAQQPAKVPRIGILTLAPSMAPTFEAFRQGLRELGYVEGQNVALEYRFAQGRADRLPALAAELVQMKVEVIVIQSTQAALAAKQATQTIPIVMAQGGDPVAAGLVASLARPGGNVTGLSLQLSELSGKRLQLLKEVAPKSTLVAVIRNVTHPNAAGFWEETEAAARSLNLRLQSVEVRSPADLDAAFKAVARARPSALITIADNMLVDNRTRVVQFAAKSRLPAIYPDREFAEAGGLMTYGPSTASNWRRAATFVDKILKGAKPADLPVEQPTRFELVVNLKTAKALGLTIPPSILVRADQVIQ